MRCSQIEIKNYKSFDETGASVMFPHTHCAIIGKNNVGKSNIFEALNILFGGRRPAYVKFDEEDFYNINSPITIEAKILPTEDDGGQWFSIPHLTILQKGALAKKHKDGSAYISIKLIKSFEEQKNGDDEQENGNEEKSADTFDISLWGFPVHRYKEEVRTAVVRLLNVPAVRTPKEQLTASSWTSFGALMKEVLEDSSEYEEIRLILGKLNDKIQTVFAHEKKELLKDARTTSYVEDIEFRLTKDNQPSELLRNIEIFIKEGAKFFNIDNVGTGTQSAVIIGVLELALQRKKSRLHLLCIEEPEAHVHPHGIRYLSSLIKNIPTDRNTQVLISTHSLSLTANFKPSEIIKVNKDNGHTVVTQDATLSDEIYKRFIHQDNAEMFFSDRVVFVEGATEKIILTELARHVKINPDDPGRGVCDFDKINTSIIAIDGVKSIDNYITIAEAFQIPYTAFLDLDTITLSDNQRACKKLCTRFRIQYPAKEFSGWTDKDKEQIRQSLKNKGILINKFGETEDLIPDKDLSAMTSKSVEDIVKMKNEKDYKGKTSKLFKEIIFGISKPEYAMRIADYYIKKNGANPFEKLIRALYANKF
jgi:putative ATP-dependent endonuclease of OLD family